jgi:hypothetical protein
MSYRLLVDENVEYRIVHKLRNYGHDSNTSTTLPGSGRVRWTERSAGIRT